MDETKTGVELGSEPEAPAITSFDDAATEFKRLTVRIRELEAQLVPPPVQVPDAKVMDELVAARRRRQAMISALNDLA